MEKVLVIEDDDTARSLMKRVIDKEGFETILAGTGKIGLELFKKEKPQIVVSDLKMPEINGIELLREIKKETPSAEVIFVTASGDYDAVIHALREGAADYLKKPLDLRELAAALSRCKERLVESRILHVKPSILLLEDDAIARKKLGRTLAKEGWTLHLAGDGEQALGIFDETKIDVVIADLRLPKMSGLDVLHEVRQRTQDCEMILISGYGDESSAIQAMKEGAINYIKKPIDVEQMVLAVQKALEKLHLRRSMLYRTRELELARKVIVKITRDSRLMVDVRNAGERPSVEYAQALLEKLPIALLVVGPEMKVVYANPHMTELLGFMPEVIDERLMRCLPSMGLKCLSLEKIKEIIDGLLGPRPPKDETVSLGKHAYIYATKLTILGKTKTEIVVLLVFRGEREGNSKGLA